MTDALIIGGGVSGLMSARELLAAGLRVRILERQTVGRESSWAGGGILSPLYPWRTPEAITRLFLWSRLEFPGLAERLREDTGIDPEWLPSGLLACDCEDAEAARTWCLAHGVRQEFPTAEQVRALEPGLGSTPAQPLYLPEIAQVRNPRLLAALRADILRRGGEILEHRALHEWRIRDGKLQGVVTEQGESFRADAYVLATGAWSGDLGRKLLPALELPVQPVKGQMILYAAPPGLLRHIVLDRGRYLIPRKDGRILMGSTVEFTGFDKSTTQDARRELEIAAREVLPALASCPVETHWGGLRPGSPTGIPYVGPHPELPNLYVNCGHFRNGFVMAPASARLLADLVLGRTPPVAPEAYALTRES